MGSYIIYESEYAYEILVRVNDNSNLGNVQKELIDKGYVIIRTVIRVFDNNDALIEAEKINCEGGINE